MHNKIGDIRLREFIHPDSIGVTAYEVEQLVESKGKYAKPGDTYWKRMAYGWEPFTDKQEAIRFAVRISTEVF